MRPTRVLALSGLLAATALSTACADSARLLAGEDTGDAPVIAPEHKRLIPTVDIAPAKGWPDGAAPVAAGGWTVAPLARGLSHPRALYVLPNGDVLVAESNAPPGKSGHGGIKGAVMKSVMKKAGAGVPSADRITLLRDADGDGAAEVREVFLSGLRSPFGMALVDGMLYVANADALVRVPYADGQTRIDAAPEKVVDLPGKGDELNHHWTKSLLASTDGQTLYVGVGSNSNVGENGIAAEENRAAVLAVDPAARSVRVFASGLRNPTALGWEPGTGALWAVVNERDELGSDLVPDYLTSVRAGAFYGWPYAYYGRPDPRAPEPPDGKVPESTKPDYALGSHVAPLGLAFHAGGAFVGLHGSWNRTPLSGYKVVFVPFAGGRPAGKMVDVLTGFVDADGDARGRPVGLAVDRRGALLVADDVGDAVWRLAPAAVAVPAAAAPAAAGDAMVAQGTPTAPVAGAR